MRYAFIADIHGNAVALEAVLEDIASKQIDKVVVLGDISYRGPEPKRALEMIQSLNTEVIKGNADEWVVRGVRAGEVPEGALALMNQERDWTVSQLDEDDIRYLEQLPESHALSAEESVIKVFHATPDSLFDVVLPNADDELMIEKMMGEDANVFVYGHIHLPYIRYIKGKVIINTGSVGLPFDGLAKASYAIVEVCSDGGINTSIERVQYDIEKVVDQYRQAQYPNADMMISIIRNGER